MEFIWFLKIDYSRTVLTLREIDFFICQKFYYWLFVNNIKEMKKSLSLSVKNVLK